MQEDTTCRPIAAPFPSAKAQLLTNRKSVTRKLPQTIRFEAGSIGIRTYLKDHNAWTERTLDNIHWDAHGASHYNHQSQHCFLIKLCHRHLPLGQRLHRRDPKYPSTCPGCREDLETQTHFLTCTADSLLQWRLQLLTNLRQLMTELHTDSNLQETILTCLNNTLAADTPPPMEPLGQHTRPRHTLDGQP
jgi:hypothetical protein